MQIHDFTSSLTSKTSQIPLFKGLIECPEISDKDKTFKIEADILCHIMSRKFIHIYVYDYFFFLN